VLLAAVVRVGFALAQRHFQLVNDPLDYHRIATSIAQGHGFGHSIVAPGDGPSAYRAPLYPISLGLLYKVVGVHIRAALLAQALVGTISAALVGLLGVQLFGRRVGAIALLLAAIYPSLILDGGSLLTESLSVPVELGAVCAAVHAQRSSNPWRWTALTGLLAGLGILNRPNTALLLIPFALLIYATGGGWRPKAGRVLFLSAVTALVLVPWLVRDERAFHRFVPLTTQTGLVSAGTYNAQADRDRSYPAAFRQVNLVPEYNAVLTSHPRMGEVEEDRRFRSLALHYAGRHPAYPLKVAFWNTLRLFDLTGPAIAHAAAQAIGYGARTADVGLYSYYAAATLAMAGLLVGQPFRGRKAVWLVPLLVVVSTVFFQGESRMRSGVEPFILLLDALAIERILVWRAMAPAVAAQPDQ
jgi:4-amino-4-deoxy-L-arabinose transferase-like glycosyltransferase